MNTTHTPLSTFINVTLCILLTTSVLGIQNLCDQPEVHRYLVISEAKIQKSKHLEFGLQLFNTPVRVNRTDGGIVLLGNFSRLVLRNFQTGVETIYEGTQMVFKIPANHVFNIQKIPQLQIQINHKAVTIQADNPIRNIMISQLYVMTTFSKSINTILSHHVHKELQDGDTVKTADIVKIFEGFPMLMYRGSTQSYPCRKDLLCLLKREYQLIGTDDFQLIKQFLYMEPGSDAPKKAYKRRSLYEIYPMKKGKGGQVGFDDQL